MRFSRQVYTFWTMLSLFYRANGGSRFLRNVGTYRPNSKASNFIIIHNFNLNKFNSITPYYTESNITPIDCIPSGPCELYTTWFLYCTTPFVHSKKGKAQKPIPRRTPCATDTDHHTWRRHHIIHVSTKLSPTHRPHPPSPHITTHYWYVL